MEVNTDINLLVFYLGHEEKFDQTGGKKANGDHKADQKNHGRGVTITDAALEERPIMIVGKIYDRVRNILLPALYSL